MGRTREGQRRCGFFSLPTLLLLSIFVTTAKAETVLVAVASNALAVTRVLADTYTRTRADDVRLASGSTGKLYAQIINGAPFDLFLAADSERPRRLEAQGFVVEGGRQSYAVGRLVLWSPRVEQGCWEQLQRGDYRWLAIANPRLAPYGLAARQTLQHLGLWGELSLVRGESIGQTYQYVRSGSAELGFVAASQLLNSAVPGCRWVVEARYHDPLQQQVVWLRRAQHSSAARAFFNFLQSSQAAAIFIAHGYRLP